MCELCKRDMNHCDDCGKLVCLDYEMEDDIVSPAHLTDDDQVLCNTDYRHYLEHQEEEDEREEYDYNHYLTIHESGGGANR